MSKKLVSVLLGSALVATMSMAACADGDKTTVTFWHAMGGVKGEAINAMIENFNASQDEIEVVAEYQGSYDDSITKLKAAMQSGEGLPDVCQMYDVGTRFMIDSEGVIPVEDMFESTGFDSSAIMEVITNYYSENGKQYAMPFNVSTPILYYNKDVFEAAGLDPEVAPTSYDEVLEFAQQIVESGAAPVGYSHYIYGWFFEQQLARLGAYYGNNENGRTGAITAVDFDQNGGGLKVFQLWKDLYDSGYFANYGTTGTDTQTAFYAGQVGMIIESSACLGDAANAAAFEVGTGFLPALEETEEGGVIIGGGSLWLIDSGDEAKENAAWKFIEYSTTPEAQAAWSMATGYLAINPAAYETEEYKALLAEKPAYGTAIEQLNATPVNNYTAGVLSGVQTESRLIFNEIIPQLYDGSMTPEDCVASLAEQVNAAIDNYNKSIQ